MAGFNFALLENCQRSISSNQNKHCVFISHKKEDEKAAIEIGKYLTEVANVNIYLDIKDCELQEAVSSENDQKIVESIKTGLKYSSHLLCLISDKTKLSWWVPYEIGFAEKQGLDIASVKLKNVEDIPSYLKIRKTIFNTDEFLKYVATLMPLNTYFFESYHQRLVAQDNSMIKRYID
jgi:hypothetical protein